jgi:hypothetical protein
MSEKKTSAKISDICGKRKMSLPQIEQIHAEKNKIEIIEYQKKNLRKSAGSAGN